MADALAAYDQIRAEHPGLNVCAFGQSAAGHVPLMVAALKSVDSNPADRGPDCIATEGSPSHLPSLEPAFARPLAVAAFTEAGLGTFSPYYYSATIRSSVLMTACATDPLVLSYNSTAMAQGLQAFPRPGRMALSLVLPSVQSTNPSPNFVHGCFVDPARLQQYRDGLLWFLQYAPRIQ